MIPTNKILVLRVSKTSFKQWTLYGAVETALKTSCQADAVKVIPIHIDEVHGHPVDLELWVNAQPATPFGGDELNEPAQAILQQCELAKLGLNRTQEVLAGRDLPTTPLVKGVAILAGAGCSEFPYWEHADCTVAALIGQHMEEEGDEGFN